MRPRLVRGGWGAGVAVAGGLLGGLAGWAAGCSTGARSTPPPEAGAPKSPQARPTDGVAPLGAEYEIAWEPAEGRLRIEARMIRVPGPLLVLPQLMAPYVHALETAPLGSAAEPRGLPAARRWTRLPLDGFPVAAPDCITACLVRYQVALREAALAFDDADWVTLHGELVEAPPSTWLLAPAMPAETPAPRLRFTVTTPPGEGFATGVFRAPAPPSASGPATPPAWELDQRDLWTSPYSAFGPMTQHTLAVPGGALEVAIGAGATAVPREQLVGWVADGARAVSAYWGRFPMPGALVLLAVTGGARSGGGKTLSGGGGAVLMQLGSRTSLARLRADWVLIHELAHLGFPSGPRATLWAQEGVASYVEPFARVRAGLLDERAAWRGLVEGLPYGLPQPGDRGLDHTPTWGRTYWGGALYWFLCDVELRKRSLGKQGLEHALRGILAAGGNNSVRWTLAEALAIGDRATGLPVLVPQYEAMKDAPYPVDLEALFRQLGVSLQGESVVFDERAPLAAVRRAITFGNDAGGAAPP
jgi:hypothetical protein